MTANLVTCGEVEGITFAGYSLLKVRGFFTLQVQGVDHMGDCFPVVYGTSLRIGGGMDMIINMAQVEDLFVSGNHDDRGQYDLAEILAQAPLLETVYFNGMLGGLTNVDLTGHANLWKVEIDGNELTTMPIGSDTLTSLGMNNNQITGTFDDLASPNLEYFYANNNQLTGEGTLPCSIIELDLGNNPIEEARLKAIITQLDTCGQTGGRATLADGNTYDPWKTSYEETKRLVDEKGWVIDGTPYQRSWVYTISINFISPVLANFYTAGNQVIVRRFLREEGSTSMTPDGSWVAGTITTSSGDDMTTQGFHATAGSPISNDPCASALYANNLYDHYLLYAGGEFNLLENSNIYPADNFDDFKAKVMAGTPVFGCTNKIFFSELGLPRDDIYSTDNNWSELDFGQVFYDWLDANRSTIEGTPL